MKPAQVTLARRTLAWILLGLLLLPGFLRAQFQIPSVTITNPTSGRVFSSSTTEVPVMASVTADPNATEIEVDFFVNDEFAATDNAAPFQLTLVDLVPGIYELQAFVFDDLVGSNGNTGSNASAVVQFRINSPPLVSLSVSNPSGTGSFFAQGQAVYLAQVDDDAELGSATITFLDGTNVLAVLDGPDDVIFGDFELRFLSLVAGTNRISVRVTDSDGATTTSQTLSVVVQPNPAAAIISPANNQAFLAEGSLLVTVEATNVFSMGAGGITNVITNVIVYADGMEVGFATNAPFGVTWSNLVAGSHSLTALAMDNAGGLAFSPPVVVNVANAIIASPTNGSSFFVGANVSVAAQVASNGVTSVDFFAGASPIASITGGPYVTILTNVQVGVSEISVRATNGAGLLTTNAVLINVIESPPFEPGPVTINHALGVLMQKVFITNPTDEPIDAARIVIAGLPPGTTVHNISGTDTNGNPYVQFNQTIGAGETVELTIEYFSRDRQSPNPTLESQRTNREVYDEPVALGAGTILDQGIFGGAFYLFFQSDPGSNAYYVQYTIDPGSTSAWKTARPAVITLRTNPTLWFDSGPPRTDRPLAADRSRVYRVIRVTP